VAQTLKDFSAKPCEPDLPPAGKLVVVICNNDNHIGYRDECGRWRHAVFHKELLNVLGWCAISAKG